MPYGLASNRGYFQSMMGKLLISIPRVKVFINDIVITGKDEAEHLENLHTIFDKLREAGLKVRKDKCEFLQDRISCLRHIIDKNGIHVSKEKCRAIKDLKIPSNPKKVSAFISKITYYDKYIKNRPETLKPLYD